MITTKKHFDPFDWKKKKKTELLDSLFNPLDYKGELVASLF